jgi:hypothetical protein
MDPSPKLSPPPGRGISSSCPAGSDIIVVMLNAVIAEHPIGKHLGVWFMRPFAPLWVTSKITTHSQSALPQRQRDGVTGRVTIFGCENLMPFSPIR